MGRIYLNYSTYIFILKEYFVYFVKLKNCFEYRCGRDDLTAIWRSSYALNIHREKQV